MNATVPLGRWLLWPVAGIFAVCGMPSTVVNRAQTVVAEDADARPAAKAVDFVRDVRPIFQRACLRCHGPD